MITLLHVQVSFPFNVLIIALPYLSLPAQIKCLQLFELGKHNHIIISLIFQPVRLLVSARTYQPANSVSLSQQISINRVYQLRNQPANMSFNSSRIGTQSLPYQQTKTLSHKSGILAGTVARSMQPDKYPAVDHEFMMQPSSTGIQDAGNGTIMLASSDHRTLLRPA